MPASPKKNKNLSSKKHVLCCSVLPRKTEVHVKAKVRAGHRMSTWEEDITR